MAHEMLRPDFTQQGFHATDDLTSKLVASPEPLGSELTYEFENFFHPFVGKLIQQLKRKSVRGMLDPVFLEGLAQAVAPASTSDKFFDYFRDFYAKPRGAEHVHVNGFAKSIELRSGAAYANYNWELFFHVPLAVAVHLSKSQRFAEAQRWFHYVFDPTCNDVTIPTPERFWKFLAFRRPGSQQLDELVALLSDPDADSAEREAVLAGYRAIAEYPFQPHRVARTRWVAYQYSVVMKYLDNLIAWGDHLFRQDTIESINEAMQQYVLAANLLGERPQLIPHPGKAKASTFAQLRGRLDEMANALVELEGELPFNLTAPSAEGVDRGAGAPLLGIGRTLYFCIPQNAKLLGYWDTVGDRLFKIRHCMNIEGVVRQLALFEPPIDPSILVKAQAAGIDVGAMVSGLHRPLGPMRSEFFIQKALELSGEVRSLGAALLSAIEKSDGERLASLRQGHEIKLQQMAEEVRFLQWKQAQESTESLLRSRASVLERYRYHQRSLGLVPDSGAAPETLPLERRELTRANFDEVHAELVTQYEKVLATPAHPRLNLVGESAADNQAGATGAGRLYLNQGEHMDLHVHGRTARELRFAAGVLDGIFGSLAMLPLFKVNVHYWGIGGSADMTGGQIFADAGRINSGALCTAAALEEAMGASDAKTAGYERRADETLLQSNQAARELMLIGRQLVGSLIAEQVAHHEYLAAKQQTEQSEQTGQFLREKFSSEQLYSWMQGETSRLYYECYRFAFDTARKAEELMKRELMRPELDATSFVKFNYWDGGRKGLLSGDALYLDVKRMELAYHEANKREYELTKHVSLRQLDPVALLTLRATGSCELALPEWLFDLDCPGHYLRRIRHVAVSIPAIAGPYASVNCTLTLQRSSVRTVPTVPEHSYARQGNEDSRFIDYLGTGDSIVTSTSSNDGGTFEANLREARFLPFEGAGVLSTWKLDLPADFRQFDYDTISDVVLHVRYSARQGGETLKAAASAHTRSLLAAVPAPNLALLWSLAQDFPSEWYRFRNGGEPFSVEIRREHFPYITQGKTVRLQSLALFGPDGETRTAPLLDWSTLSAALNTTGNFQLCLEPDAALTREGAPCFAVVHYSIA